MSKICFFDADGARMVVAFTLVLGVCKTPHQDRKMILNQVRKDTMSLVLGVSDRTGSTDTNR